MSCKCKKHETRLQCIRRCVREQQRSENKHYWGTNNASEESLYVDLLTKDPKNKILLFGMEAGHLSGYVDSNYVFGASANYSTDSIASAVGNFGGDTIKSLANMFGLTNFAGGTQASHRLSALKWNSSVFRTIPFEVFIMATRPGQNPLDEANKIWNYVLPTEGKMGMMKPPGGYTAGYVSGFFGGGHAGLNNAAGLAIGDWFYAPNIFVVTDAQVEISKQKQMDGTTPLYVKITMTLTIAKEVTAEEVQKWFIGRSG